MSGTGWVIVVAASLIYVGVILTWALRRARRNSPSWIVRQLQEKGTVKVGVRYAGGTWNPSKDSVEGRVWIRGQATYTLDDAGIVHLRIEPKKGAEQTFSGPIPQSLVHPSEKSLRVRKRVRALLLGYLAFIVIGFFVGFAVAGGPALHRLIAGLIGMAVAIILAWFLVTVLRVWLSIRSLAKQKETASH